MNSRRGMRYFRCNQVPIWKTSLLILLGVSLLPIWGCIKIDDFSEAHMLEVFMGRLDVTPVLKGFVGASGTGVVTITGDETGERVTISGLPKNEPFDLLPEKMAEKYPLPLNVAGFVGAVEEGTSIRIDGFKQISAGAEELEAIVVEGLIIRDGPRIVTKIPIVIGVRSKPLKAILLQTPFAPFITRSSDGTKLADIEDDEIIELYEVYFKGDITSIL